LSDAAFSIDARQLTKKFGAKEAVADATFEVARSEVFGFLGPNGAGKTTTISAIAGLAQRSAGTIRIFGYDNQSQWREARRLIGLSPQEYNFDRYLSLRDVLIFAAGYYGLRGKAVAERADMLLERFGLTKHAHLEYTKISGGQKRRLSLARALIHEPKLLILDEPTAGVDVELRLELWDWLRTLNRDGLTIFLTTHYLEEAEELCRRIAIIRNGRIVTEKATEELVAEGASLQDVFLEMMRN
jgi:ABC-2 type transport system ATP-binding protein